MSHDKQWPCNELGDVGMGIGASNAADWRIRCAHIAPAGRGAVVIVCVPQAARCASHVRLPISGTGTLADRAVLSRQDVVLGPVSAHPGDRELRLLGVYRRE